MSFHRHGVVLSDHIAARLMAPFAARENIACRAIWGNVTWNSGKSDQGQRRVRVEATLEAIKRRPIKHGTLAGKIGV